MPSTSLDEVLNQIRQAGCANGPGGGGGAGVSASSAGSAGSPGAGGGGANPFEGLFARPTAPATPKPKPVEWSNDKIAVIKAYRRLTGANLADAKNAVEQVVEAINEVRTPDAQGTLRRQDEKYAFAYAEGEYLLIESGSSPRFKKADSWETKQIKSNWEIVLKGGA